MTRALPAVLIAATGALLLAVPEILGIATWKWALGVLGLVLFVAGGRRRTPSSGR
jgi:hypothetical protein